MASNARIRVFALGQDQHLARVPVQHEPRDLRVRNENRELMSIVDMAGVGCLLTGGGQMAYDHPPNGPTRRER